MKSRHNAYLSSVLLFLWSPPAPSINKINVLFSRESSLQIWYPYFNQMHFCTSAEKPLVRRKGRSQESKVDMTASETSPGVLRCFINLLCFMTLIQCFPFLLFPYFFPSGKHIAGWELGGLPSCFCCCASLIGLTQDYRAITFLVILPASI